MKKIVASVGLVALGATGVQTASAQDITAPDNSKPWTISATLRGFYDDNVSSWPNDIPVPNGFQRGSWGFEITPAGNGSWLRVFIDYTLPERAPTRWLGRLFGRYYAR